MKSVQGKLTLISFLNGLCFYGPVALLVRTQAGISISQFFSLQMLLSLSIFLFEIPAGVLSDRMGYKRTIVLSQLSLLISTILLLIANSYWIFTIQAIAQGLAISLTSGTYSAYLYCHCQGEEYALTNSKIGQAGTIGYLLSTVSYSLILSLSNIKGLVTATCLSTTGALLLSLLLPTEMRKKQTATKAGSLPLKHPIFRKSWYFFPLLSSITISYLVINFFYALKVEKIGLDYEFMTILILGYSAVELLSPVLIHRLKAKHYGRTIVLLLLMAATAFGSIFALGSLWSLIPMILLPLLLSVCSYLLDEQLNERIDQHQLQDLRATILSLFNMGCNLLEVGFLGASALLSGNEGNIAFLLAAGWLLLISSVAVLSQRQSL